MNTEVTDLRIICDNLVTKGYDKINFTSTKISNFSLSNANLDSSVKFPEFVYEEGKEISIQNTLMSLEQFNDLITKILNIENKLQLFFVTLNRLQYKLTDTQKTDLINKRVLLTES